MISRGQGALEYLLIVGGGVLVAVVIIASVLQLGGTGTGGSQIALAGQTCNTFTTESLCESASFSGVTATGSDASISSCTSTCCFGDSLSVGKKCYLNSTAQNGTATVSSACENGSLDPGEVCDGSNFLNGSNKCEDFSSTSGFPYAPGETVTCAPNCDAVIFDSCSSCGNDVIENGFGEACDGGNLNGKDCTDFGFFFGTLTCKPASDPSNPCTFDSSACRNVQIRPN